LSEVRQRYFFVCKIILIIVLSTFQEKLYLTIHSKTHVLGSLSNTELAVRLRNGDLEAFNTLYWKYHTALYLNVIRLTKDPGLAEDIVQEVFIKLWEKKHTLKEEESISGWLFTVSYHKAVDVLKQRLKEAAVIKLLTIPQEDPEKANVTEKQIDMLNRALEHLSPQKSRVFTLCKVEGKSYEQASVQLNISKHTVKEYLSEAIKSVKIYLNNHPELKTAIALVLITKEFISAVYF
jgi:RNA polymerase sigma factor (sigma-70 family)